MNDTERIERPDKKEIRNNFGRSAQYYDTYAVVQKEAADRLLAALRPWKDSLPSGPILETGCGTGFVTEGLAELFPERELEITDIAPEMVDYCRKKIGENPQITYRQLDAEQIDSTPASYAMILSGFVAQWFRNPALTLGKQLESIKPGGLLLATFPGSESFPGWKEACREVGLPFTGNTLPDTEEMVVKLSGGPVQIDYYEDDITQSFDSAARFFSHLKQLGAGTQSGGRHLSPKELKLLIDHWDDRSDGDIEVTYHVVFIAVKRNYDS